MKLVIITTIVTYVKVTGTVRIKDLLCVEVSLDFHLNSCDRLIIQDVPFKLTKRNIS